MSAPLPAVANDNDTKLDAAYRAAAYLHFLPIEEDSLATPDQRRRCVWAVEAVLEFLDAHRYCPHS